MSLIHILEPDFIFKDERGRLVQLVREGFSQFNVIESIEGAVRGGHFHKLNNEAFFVVKGKLKLDTWDIGRGQDKEQYTFKTGDMFEIPANVVHGFIFDENTILISMYDMGVELDNGEKDIHVEEGNM